MARLTLCAVRAIVVVLVLPASAWTQSTRVEGGLVPAGDVAFLWEMHLTPPVPPLADGFVTTAFRDEMGTIHRVLLDRVRRVMFGYQVRVDTERWRDRYLLRFEPLSLTPERSRELLGDDFATWSQLGGPAAGAGSVQRLRPERVQVGVPRGQVIEMHLLTTDSGQTLTDYISIQPPDVAADRAFLFAPGAVRDFSAEDVEMRLDRPTIGVSQAVPTGTPVAGRTSNPTRSFTQGGVDADVSGRIVWIYVPDGGRYLLSLAPHARFGFQRAGEVRGTTLRFTVGDTSITVNTASRIAPGQAAFRLYVLHERGWTPPNGAQADAFAVGADAMELVVGR